jgi:hypothetical protein
MVLFAVCISGCNPDQSVTKIASLSAISATPQRETKIAPTSAIPATPLLSPTSTSLPSTTAAQRPPAPGLADYTFPGSIDAAKQYLFYLHGKIVEDQGIPAVSPDFGEYEYEAILEKLGGYGFEVISEQRPKDTDGLEYARKVTAQVKALLEAGVPAENITVVGASKGAGIAVYVSHLLKNREINFVIMAICNPDAIEEFRQNQIYLYGNVLSIYDSKDELAGSCQELFEFSQGKGIGRSNEVVLNVGTGHGILYKPLDEWVIPLVQWARK